VLLASRLACAAPAATSTSRWRPVRLREGVFYRGAIRFSDGERKVKEVSRFDDLNLCLDTVAEGGQCLVFVSSRRNAEAFAKELAWEHTQFLDILVSGMDDLGQVFHVNISVLLKSGKT
jgi:replicative superfamily II helicase